MGRSFAVPISIGMEHFVKVLTDAFFYNFDMNMQELLILYSSLYIIIISIILSSYLRVLGTDIFAILQTCRSLNRIQAL